MKNNLKELNDKAMVIFLNYNADIPPVNMTGVSQLLEEIKSSVDLPGSPLSIWAATELQASEQALNAGYPQIALMSAIKAIEISQLSPKEYSYAFDVLLQEQDRSIKQKELQAHSWAFTDQATAEMLAVLQENAAHVLNLSQQMKAAELQQIQSDMAAELLEENLCETVRMAAISTDEVQKFAERECQRNLYQQELQDILSWAAGAYSVSTAPLETNIQNLYEAMINERELTATRLSERQKKSAHELRIRNENAAALLKKNETKMAQVLLAKYAEKAERFAEKQEIKSLHDKKVAEDNVRMMMF